MSQPSEQAALLGSRIRIARERLNLSQEKLASKVGFNSAQIISTIESGVRELKVSELNRIANSLKTSIDALLNSDLQVEPKFLWREQPEAGFEQNQAIFLRRCERYGLVEKWCDILGHHKPMPIVSLTARPSYGEVQAQAEQVRNFLQLGGRPACALEKTLQEDQGVKILYGDLGPAGGGSAFSVKSWFGEAVLLNSCEAPWRRNYSLAHELFHLLVPDDSMTLSKDQIEILANVFAAALLLPAEHLLAAVSTRESSGKISYEGLIEIAREFDVSIDALLWRLVNLGRFESQKAKELCGSKVLRTMDKASFPAREKRNPLPERYIRLCFFAYRQGLMGLAKMAEFLETGIVDLAEQVRDIDSELATGEEAEVTFVRC